MGRARNLMRGIYIPQSKWTRSFLVVTLIQTAVALSLEGLIFAKFTARLKSEAQPFTETKTISTYLALYAFALIYGMTLVYDALRQKNTVQVIGLCMCNICLLIYSVVQVLQINKAAVVLLANGAFTDNLRPIIEPYLIAIPCLLALGSTLMIGIGWKLYQEFAWEIYQQISADLQISRRYLAYELYITLLKFDFFFFHGFSVQLLVVLGGMENSEFNLTAVAIPVTILILCLAVIFVRRENTFGKVIIILLYFGSIAYLIFKLVRMHEDPVYVSARNSLTFFATSTIILVSMTIVNACICVHNFHQGLRPHINRRRHRERVRTFVSTSYGNTGARMTID